MSGQKWKQLSQNVHRPQEKQRAASASACAAASAAARPPAMRGTLGW
jgi:hypothetical protein